MQQAAQPQANQAFGANAESSGDENMANPAQPSSSDNEYEQAEDEMEEDQWDC